MKRIEVDPADVRVVGAPGPSPAKRDSRFFLRLKIAGLLACAEIIAVALGSVSVILLMVLAVVFVGFHFFVGRRLPTMVRHVTWILALAQALAALFIAAIGTALIVLGIVVILALLIALMMLLGERR